MPLTLPQQTNIFPEKTLTSKIFVMADFYKGTEIKFKVELTAVGFSMDDDPFDIKVSTSRNSSVEGKKTDTSAKQGSQDVSIVKEDTEWYVIVKTDNLQKGDMRVIATAHITDTGAFDGVRNEIAIAPLGRLLEP